MNYSSAIVTACMTRSEAEFAAKNTFKGVHWKKVATKVQELGRPIRSVADVKGCPGFGASTRKLIADVIAGGAGEYAPVQQEGVQVQVPVCAANTNTKRKRKAEPSIKFAEPKKKKVALSFKLSNSKPETYDATGKLLSEKLDGVRARKPAGSLTFYSRGGNTFCVPEWWAKQCPQDALDGELMYMSDLKRKESGRGNFQTVTEIIRNSEDPRWNHMRYFVFDAPEHPGTFQERVQHYHAVCSTRSFPDNVALPVEQVRCASVKQMQRMFDRIVKEGGEGLMIGDPTAAYVGGRTDSLLKWKPTYDAEAEVLEHVMGKGKFSDCMGALMVRMACGKTFKLGTGFSDAVRRNPPPIKSIVTYKFNDVTKGGIPRHARFVRVRPDVSVPSDFDFSFKRAPRQQDKQKKEALDLVMESCAKQISVYKAYERAILVE